VVGEQGGKVAGAEKRGGGYVQVEEWVEVGKMMWLQSLSDLVSSGLEGSRRRWRMLSAVGKESEADGEAGAAHRALALVEGHRRW
jgi:hypothetical protein